MFECSYYLAILIILFNFLLLNRTLCEMIFPFYWEFKWVYIFLCLLETIMLKVDGKKMKNFNYYQVN